jgi:hypothetical protein
MNVEDWQRFVGVSVGGRITVKCCGCSGQVTFTLPLNDDEPAAMTHTPLACKRHYEVSTPDEVIRYFRECTKSLNVPEHQDVHDDVRALNDQIKRDFPSPLGFQQLRDNIARLTEERDQARTLVDNANAIIGQQADELFKLTEERDAERLRYGQERAKVAVYIRALAETTSTRPKWAQSVVKRADEAAANVRLEDFVEVKASKGEDR